MNSGNCGHGGEDDCDNNSYFGIGDYDDDVINYGYGTCGDHGFESCVPFDPHQSRTICTHRMSKINIYELLHDDDIQDNRKHIDL